MNEILDDLIAVRSSCEDAQGRWKMNEYSEFNGLFFSTVTPYVIKRIVSNCYHDHTRLRFCFGDKITGKDWCETYDTTGTIGRSTGSVKIPLLIKTKRSLGGSGLSCDSIVKIEIKKGRKYVEIYKHTNYHKEVTE
jgi:hypothetical protein